MDTIYALASARGKAGVSVIRVSGEKARDVLRDIAGDIPETRRASLRKLRDEKGRTLDEALVLSFDRGASFTGEASAELHVHGGAAVVSAILDRLARIPGCRIAEPGEFTRRALENDRLDLAQVEGLGELIEAETEAQRIQAMRVFSGALGAKVEAWRGALVSAAASLEATIDFADEEIPENAAEGVADLIRTVIRDLRDEIRGSAAAERIRDGFEVAIVGPPNIGKSTLLNRLAGRDAALTSELAGTTRDVVEVRMDLRGLPVTLLDTAGLRETEDSVETMGIERARSRAEAADLRIFLVEDADSGPEMDAAREDVVAVGKADLGGGRDFAVSGLTGEGVDELIERVASTLETRAGAAMTATRERHRNAMISALERLEEAAERLSEESWETEVIAEEIRAGIRSLESLVGRVDVDHVLDEVFARFCIGK